MTMTDHIDEEIGELYEQIEELKKNKRNNEIPMVMGDFNRKIEGNCNGKNVWPFGLREGNVREFWLREFVRIGTT